MRLNIWTHNMLHPPIWQKNLVKQPSFPYSCTPSMNNDNHEDEIVMMVVVVVVITIAMMKFSKISARIRTFSSYWHLHFIYCSRIVTVQNNFALRIWWLSWISVVLSTENGKSVSDKVLSLDKVRAKAPAHKCLIATDISRIWETQPERKKLNDVFHYCSLGSQCVLR